MPLQTQTSVSLGHSMCVAARPACNTISGCVHTLQVFWDPPASCDTLEAACWTPFHEGVLCLLVSWKRMAVYSSAMASMRCSVTWTPKRHTDSARVFRPTLAPPDRTLIWPLLCSSPAGLDLGQADACSLVQRAAAASLWALASRGMLASGAQAWGAAGSGYPQGQG